MGGKESVDFLAPSGSGENTLVTLRERRLRGRPRNRARRTPSARVPRAPRCARGGRDARASTTIEGLAEFLDIDAAATSKAMPVVKPDGTLVLGAGSRRRPARARRRWRPRSSRTSGRRPKTRSVRRSGPIPGRSAPVGFEGEVIADEALRDGQFVAGANLDRPASERRRGRSRLRAALRRPATSRSEGDACPNCGGALRFQTAIEVGHIFKFGTPLLGAARREVPRRGRRRAAARRGQLRRRPCPGDGGDRRAAPRRARDPLAGRRSRPTTSHVVALAGVETQAEEVAAALDGAGQSRPARRPRAARGGEVRRRRLDRLPAADHGREEDARGRRRRCPGPRDR